MKRPGDYVASILNLRSERERADAINRVPAHFRGIVRKAVADELAKREGR